MLMLMNCSINSPALRYTYTPIKNVLKMSLTIERERIKMIKKFKNVARVLK